MPGMENIPDLLSEFLTTKEVAERLGVSIQKVHRLMLYKHLPVAFKLDGKTGRYYFRADDVEAFIAKRAS